MGIKRSAVFYIIPFIIVLGCEKGTGPAPDTTKEVVLQNGTNNYVGCTDSYIFHKGDKLKNDSTNYSRDSLLLITNCPS